MIQKTSLQFLQGFFDADGSVQILLRSGKQNKFIKKKYKLYEKLMGSDINIKFDQ